MFNLRSVNFFVLFIGYCAQNLKLTSLKRNFAKKAALAFGWDNAHSSVSFGEVSLKLYVYVTRVWFGIQVSPRADFSFSVCVHTGYIQVYISLDVHLQKRYKLSRNGWATFRCLPRSALEVCVLSQLFLQELNKAF